MSTIRVLFSLFRLINASDIYFTKVTKPHRWVKNKHETGEADKVRILSWKGVNRINNS